MEREQRVIVAVDARIVADRDCQLVVAPAFTGRPEERVENLRRLVVAGTVKRSREGRSGGPRRGSSAPPAAHTVSGPDRAHLVIGERMLWDVRIHYGVGLT